MQPVEVIGEYDRIVAAATGIVRCRAWWDAQARTWTIAAQCVVCGAQVAPARYAPSKARLDAEVKLFAGDVEDGRAELRWACVVGADGYHQGEIGLHRAFRAAAEAAESAHERLRRTLPGKSPEAWVRAFDLADRAEQLRRAVGMIVVAYRRRETLDGHQPAITPAYDAWSW